jgi:hypothetical protein
MGTFQYHSIFSEYRNFFRGTSAHNTITLRDKNQSTIQGRMMWSKKAKTRLIQFDSNENNVKLIAEHNGYKNYGVTHRRELYYQVDKCLEITDYLTSVQKTTATIFFHFHPDVTIERQAHSLLIQNGNEKLEINNLKINEARVIKGSREPFMGWYSEKFDKMTPTITLAIDLEIEGETSFITKFKEYGS